MAQKRQRFDQRFRNVFETLIRNTSDISKGIKKRRKINSSGRCSNLVKSFVAGTTYFTIVVGNWQWPGIKLVFLFPFVETIPAVWVEKKKKFIRSIRLFFFRLDNVRILSPVYRIEIPIVELKILLYFLLNHFVRCCITDLIFKYLLFNP